MTIYKPKIEKKDSENGAAKLLPPYVIRVPGASSTPQHQQLNRRRCIFKIICIFLFLLIILVSVMTGLYVFKKLAFRPLTAVCSVRYREGQRSGSFEEMLEVEGGRHGYAKLNVPSFYDSLPSLVVHDFQMNLSAIVDGRRARCYVMKMDRSVIQPPTSIIDLLNKFNEGYYVPEATILRESYTVQLPEVEDVYQMGERIFQECQYYTTYRITKNTGEKVKRASSSCSMAGENYCLGMTSEKFIPCLLFSSCV